jgi:tetratricopeptide (TPR) repeat protein
MAYKEIAWSYASIGNLDKRREYFEKALAHSKSLPEKEKLLIEGYYYSDYEETFDKAKATFKKLLNIYPEDSEANMKFGGLYFICEEWDKAIAYFKKATDNINPDPQPYAFLAWAYMAVGKYEQSRETIESYHKAFPVKVRLQGLKCDSYIIEGKYPLAALALEKIEKKSVDNILRQGEISLFTGDLKRAEKKFQELKGIIQKKALLDNDLSYIGSINKLGHLYLLQGKFNESIKLLEENIRLIKPFDFKLTLVFELALLYLRLDRPQDAMRAIENAMKAKGHSILPFYNQMKLFYMSFIYLKLGLTREMEIALARLKEQVDRGVLRTNIRYYYLIKGMSERNNKNYKQAIDYLKKAISYLSHQIRKDFYFSHQAVFVYELAVTYLEAGDLENAQKRFEEVISMTFGRLYFGDLFAESYYYAGKIYEQKGWKKKAKEAYGAFLRLWQNSDRGWRENIKHAAREYLKKIEI